MSFFDICSEFEWVLLLHTLFAEVQLLPRPQLHPKWLRRQQPAESEDEAVWNAWGIQFQQSTKWGRLAYNGRRHRRQRSGEKIVGISITKGAGIDARWSSKTTIAFVEENMCGKYQCVL